MKKYLFIFLWITATITSSEQLYAQEKLSPSDFRKKFEEANVLTEDKFYNLALPIWLELLEQDPENANLNFRVGECYYNIPNQKRKSLPYFEKALNNIKKNYTPFDPNEDGAKVDVYYYIAHVYHITNEIDKAIEYFNLFKENASKKHYLMKDVDHQISMCYNAKEALQNPIRIKVINLGNTINSEYPDYSPVPSLDENILYFTSRRLRKDSSNIYYKDVSDGLYFEDIYVAYRNLKGEWTEPELMEFNKVNDHTATISLSPDGMTLFIYNDDNGNGNIYQSKLEGDQWSFPEPLPEPINTKYFETHASLSNDGQTIYFTSDRPGGLGGKDIYRCKKLPTGEWSEPMNLGPAINTPYDEDGPFIHPDGKTLFFSSQGHKSIGGYDIFYSEKQEDGTWSKPTNIGYPINSTDDDIFYVPTPDGKRAYYSSVHEKEGYGYQDIYMIEQIDAEEKALTLLKGHIRVPEGQELPEDIMIYITDNETGALVQQVRPNHRTGSYVFIIPPGKNYHISYEVNGQEFYSDNIYVPYGSEYNEINKEILLNPLDLTGSQIVAKANDHPEPIFKVRYKNDPSKQIPEGLVVNYLNENGVLIYKEATDKNGYFRYHKLPPAQEYIFNIESDDVEHCDILEIVLQNEGVDDINHIFQHDKECSYYRKNKKYAYIKMNAMPKNIQVKFIDENGVVRFIEEVDEHGKFRYHELKDEPLYIRPMNVDNCEDVAIIIEENGEKKQLMADANCSFDTKSTTSAEKKLIGVFDFKKLNMNIPKGLKVQYLDENGKVLFTENVAPDGTFKYHAIPDDKFRLKIIGEDFPCDRLTTRFVDEKTHLKTYLELVSDKNCLFLPEGKPQQKLTRLVFQEYYPYNANIPTKEAEFNKFIDILVEKIQKEGTAQVSIESSASRVPTRTYKTNENLSKLRAENAKKKILEKLKERGISANKVRFVDITTLVQGPKYKGDYLENKSTYEKFQYVKIYTN